MIDKKPKETDSDKAIASAGTKKTKTIERQKPKEISQDMILSEKDEVKFAEEKLRLKNK